MRRRRVRAAFRENCEFDRASNRLRVALARNLRAKEEYPLQILVRDNNIDQALRVLKKKMQREGIFREMKQRRFFEKPSERTVRERAEAIRRARKLARKQAQREGLIADPKKTKLLAAKALAQRQGTGDRPPPFGARGRSGPPRT
jgi:small subunit ribosomal protein S21